MVTRYLDKQSVSCAWCVSATNSPFTIGAQWDLPPLRTTQRTWREKQMKEIKKRGIMV